MQSKEAQKELRESRQWERAAVAAGGKRRKKGTVRSKRVLLRYRPGTARRGCAPQPMDGAGTCGESTVDTCEKDPSKQEKAPASMISARCLLEIGAG